jgi:hypothetical protein
MTPANRGAGHHFCKRRNHEQSLAGLTLSADGGR